MKLLSFFVVLTAICQASTTYTVNKTITLDPNGITSSSGNEFYTLQFSNTSAVTVQSGDTITGTVSFVGGPILIEAPSGDFNEAVGIFFSQATSAGLSTGSTANLQFLGLNGVFPETNPTPPTNNGGGPLIAFEFSNGQAFDFSFTGFTYTINITSLNTTPAPFYFSQFNLGGQTILFGSSVPEPSTEALCGIGCLGLVWAVRRHRVIEKHARTTGPGPLGKYTA
jgi:hypothetical protein